MSTSIISKEVRSILVDYFKDRVYFNIPLASFLHYRVGGPADALVFVREVYDLFFLRDLGQRYSIPLTVIGSGTNLLVLDGGIRGIVLSLREAFRGITKVLDRGEGVVVRAESGVLKQDLLWWAQSRGLSNLEFSSGVPGTIGGGIFMNAGTKYGCYGDILERMAVFSFDEGLKVYSREEVDFQYRRQNLVNSRSLLIWAEFLLKRKDPALIRQSIERIIKERESKQPLDFPSCGSTFKNPPGYSAGRLIEKCGLKGRRVGGAMVSLKHANFILNLGNAKAEDILKLIAIVKKEVYNKFNILLEEEVIILGQAADPNQIDTFFQNRSCM